MKTMLTSAATSAALALAFLTASTWADDAKAPPSPEELMQAMAAAGRPGPEHAKLQPLVGSWTYTCKLWMDPSEPPIETTGTIERRWILGGRFLEEKIVGEGFGGESFEGLGLVGYDNGRGKYISSWACSMGTGISTGLGKADPSGKKLTFHMEGYCPVQNKTITTRDELRIEGDNKTVSTSYMIEDGAEIKMLEIVAVRNE